MPKYIDADAFVKENREWYCEQCEKRKGMKRGRLQFVYDVGDAPCRACDVDDMISDIEDFPAADVEPKQRWIPVTERLPKRPKNWPHCELRRCYFLVALESGCVKSLGFEFDTMEWHNVGSPVTHWMPLPEPPKKERKEADNV